MQAILKAVGVKQDSLDDILGVFTNTTKRLDAYMLRQLDEFGKATLEISKQEERRDIAKGNAARADTVARRIREIIG
mgnify:CR=1 FL=1